MLYEWRRLGESERSFQTDGAGPFCINCLYQRRKVLADWYCRDGPNRLFWCHHCAFDNMLFGGKDLREKLIELLVSQDDPVFQMLGDALTRKEVREVLPPAPQPPVKAAGKRRSRKTTDPEGGVS